MGVPVVLAENSTDMADQGKRVGLRCARAHGVPGCGSALRGGCLGGQLGQVPVDGGSGDAELGGDLLHGVDPAPVGPGLL